jgi:arylsulfatase A-like enzyme
MTTTSLPRVLAAFCSGLFAIAGAQAAKSKPNILLIIADDMGYSDISCFGGEIKTPHLDALAKSGLRATNFYVAPTCSPTRSMLLSGCDHHVAGFGNMDELAGPKQKGKPGYEGYLNDRVVPVAKVLKEAGYHTYWAGKSHMGYDPSQWPAAMGFERDFTLLQGGGSNWSDMTYPNPAHPKLTFTLNGKPLDKLPDDHFSSEAYTDFIIKSNEEHKADGKPFFAYLSFQAVHSPFAAPDDWLDKYKGVYDKGYDAIRAERLERMKELGIVSKDTALAAVAHDSRVGRPHAGAEKTLRPPHGGLCRDAGEHGSSHRALDRSSQTNGQYENTVVVFLSDNGAEPVELGAARRDGFQRGSQKMVFR